MSEFVCRLKPHGITRRTSSRVDPDEIGVKALSYLAEDDERLGRFLTICGIAPNAMRAASDLPGFFLGLLDYVMTHEPLVLGLAEYARISPEAVMQAHAALAYSPDD